MAIYGCFNTALHIAANWVTGQINLAYRYRSIVIAYTLSIFPFGSGTAGNIVEPGSYLGLGPSYITINSGHPSIEKQSIVGFSIFYGVRYQAHILELSMGGGSGVDTEPTYDIYYPGDTADYGYISISYQYQFLDLADLFNSTPFIGAGYSFDSINWQNYVYDHSGDGFELSTGLIFQTGNNWSVNVSMRYHRFSGEKVLFSAGDYRNYDTETYILTAALYYHFGSRQSE